MKSLEELHEAVREFLWAHESDPDLLDDLHFIHLRETFSEVPDIAEARRRQQDAWSKLMTELVTCGWCHAPMQTYGHVKKCRRDLESAEQKIVDNAVYSLSTMLRDMKGRS